MRIKFFNLAGPGLMIAAGMAVAVTGTAKDKLMNIQGRVQMTNKEGSSFTVEEGSARREVIYSGDTKFVYGHSKANKPGAADQVKEGYFVSCAGTFDAKAKLVARECVYREEK